MAETIRLIDPKQLKPNPENPRLIFRQDELDALQASIKAQGILVPLTIFQDGNHFVLLDGERRWRCAVKLALNRVPAIIQPKPDTLQNIMMMFAIHNTRKEWDPLPTAYKLEKLERVFTKRNGRKPSETELAQLASMSRGEVRRLRNLLELPKEYQDELMAELEKPRSEQVITVDHVLEATRGVAALRQRNIVTADEENNLRRAVVDKFRTGVIKNTVAPRQLARIARAVDRQEIPLSDAKRLARKLTQDPDFGIDDAFASSVEHVDFEHSIEQLANRLQANLETHLERGYEIGQGLTKSLRKLSETLNKFLSS